MGEYDINLPVHCISHIFHTPEQRYRQDKEAAVAQRGSGTYNGLVAVCGDETGQDETSCFLRCLFETRPCLFAIGSLSLTTRSASEWCLDV